MVQYACFEVIQEAKMRVISGTARGISLKAPEGLGTRPTTDRVKENLFNIIQQEIRDRAVLDIFSGSGALSIEALSRGAREAVLVEADKKCYTVISDNLKRTRLSEKARIIQSDADTALKQLQREGRTFDLVFMDPPYQKGWVPVTLKQLIDLQLLNIGAMVVAEHEDTDAVPEEIGSLQRVSVKKYGRTALSIYREVNP